MADAYDLIIIGGGAAGFTAGLYAARDRCRALLLERFSAGGQVLNCEHIENYPGFPDGIAGYSLGPLLQQQATNLGLEMKLAEVHEVRLDGETKVLQTDDGEVRAKALIIASGSSFTKLGIPGEEEILGNGVSHSAPCDGGFFRDQRVEAAPSHEAQCDTALPRNSSSPGIPSLVKLEPLAMINALARTSPSSVCRTFTTPSSLTSCTSASFISSPRFVACCWSRGP